MLNSALLIIKDAELRGQLEACLPAHWSMEAFEEGTEALDRLSAGGIDLVLVDGERFMKSRSALLLQLRTLVPWTPILALFPEGEREQASLSLTKGATDFLLTPIYPEVARFRIEAALGRAPKKSSIPTRKPQKAVLMGQSPAMLGVREQAVIVAPTEIPVLILGESGTGRGVVARQIHYQSPRANGPFVVCSSLGVSEKQLSADFFGEKAAGGKPRPGRLDEASGGTLFFDEVGDLPLRFQRKLLPLLKGPESAGEGNGEPRAVNVRFIFASSRDLAGEMAAKRFREDLYYRIQTFPLRIPPLRERSEDIPSLVTLFLKSYCEELGKPFKSIDAEAMECLLWYPWPGNVRELQTRMRFCALSMRGGDLHRGDLPFELQGYSGTGVGSYVHARLSFERDYLTRLLRKHRGNIHRMAQEAGKHRVEIYRMLKRCGLDQDKFRE